MSESFQAHELWPARLLYPRNFLQEYWSGLPFLSLGDLPDPGIKPLSLVSPALTVKFFSISTTWEAHGIAYLFSRAVVLALAATLASSYSRSSPFLHLIGLARLPIVHSLPFRRMGWMQKTEQDGRDLNCC